MKYFALLTLFFIIGGFTCNEPFYIHYWSLEDKYVKIGLNHNSIKKYRINKSELFFIYKDEKIFIKPDSSVKLNVNIEEIIKNNFDFSGVNYSSSMPIIDIIFIVDKNGTILENGIARDSQEKYYNGETIKLTRKIKSSVLFRPALIQGKNVGGVYRYRINFFDPYYQTE